MEEKISDNQNKKTDKPANDDKPQTWEEAMGAKNNFAIWKIIAIAIMAVLLALKLLL